MSSQAGTVYSLDANVLIYAWNDVYSPEFIPAFWDKLDALIAEGRGLICEEVYHEVTKKDSDLAEWVKARPQMIVPLDDEIQEKVTEILRTHPMLIKARKNRSGGDPFVIAMAICKNAVVVSQEGNGNETSPRIPDVCRAYKVPQINLRDLIREEKWLFE